MTRAAEAREAVLTHPFVYEGLRAGILNYAATARFLGLGDGDAVGAALRRYAEDLPTYEPVDDDVRITMQRGLGALETDEDRRDALLMVGEIAFVPDAGSLTAILAHGSVTPRGASRVLHRAGTVDLDIHAHAADETMLCLVVAGHDGADTVRIVEDSLP